MPSISNALPDSIIHVTQSSIPVVGSGLAHARLLSAALVGATSLIIASIGALVARLALLGPGIATVGALYTETIRVSHHTHKMYSNFNLQEVQRLTHSAFVIPMFTQKSPLSAPLVQETPPAWRKQASSPEEPPQQQLGSVFPGAILHYRRVLVSFRLS